MLVCVACFGFDFVGLGEGLTEFGAAVAGEYGETPGFSVAVAGGPVGGFEGFGDDFGFYFVGFESGESEGASVGDVFEDNVDIVFCGRLHAVDGLVLDCDGDFVSAGDLTILFSFEHEFVPSVIVDSGVKIERPVIFICADIDLGAINKEVHFGFSGRVFDPSG